MGNTQMPVPATALDHESTIVTAVELSASSWLVGAQVPSVLRQCRHKLAPSAEALLEHLGRLRQLATSRGVRRSTTSDGSVLSAGPRAGRPSRLPRMAIDALL